MALAALVLSFALSASVASATEHIMRTQAQATDFDAFDGYVAAFERPYKRGTSEYAQRRALYDKNTKEIALHNARSDRSWTAGVNHLTDRTAAEFAQLLGWKGGPRTATSAGDVSASLLETDVELASSVDWLSKNLTAFSHVANQGGCGSCWAVTSVALLESRYEIANKKFRSFSAQQLVDCVPNEKACGGTGGCDGATVELAMQYVLDNGLSTKHDRPYHGVDHQCKENPELFGGKKKDSEDSSLVQADPSEIEDSARVGGAAEIGLVSFATLPSNKAAPMMQALMEGPVAISVGANDWSFYSSGVFDKCGKGAIINHAVLAVGYGHDKSLSKNYYTIRNSWGGSWGEEGHIRLLRGKTVKEDESYCGTDSNPKEGIACKPYPESVEVCGQCGMLYDSVATKHQQAAGLAGGGDADAAGESTGAIVGSLIRRESRHAKHSEEEQEDGPDDRQEDTASVSDEIDEEEEERRKGRRGTSLEASTEADEEDEDEAEGED